MYRREMKNFTALFMALALAAGVMGCGSSKSDTDHAGADAAEAVTESTTATDAVEATEVAENTEETTEVVTESNIEKFAGLADETEKSESSLSTEETGDGISYYVIDNFTFSAGNTMSAEEIAEAGNVFCLSKRDDSDSYNGRWLHTDNEVSFTPTLQEGYMVVELPEWGASLFVETDDGLVVYVATYDMYLNFNRVTREEFYSGDMAEFDGLYD